ncbi:DNA polymerase III subunit gamma/tau [Neptunomonas qingdaonensis]|uniref:DNA polymerase III subunit gamma/tau n=1 Tax=Neptunomonas qingdaonensis TaxID=1045558 RepID=A0A1I2SMK7_9GAMM|nr:DNA polymerase III subunit gamma/tau [Neptunomonas qingdaonensis]SFG53823.1 DNA polymerase-3 subunit gamma/tau [Neptunomonas qingdaonensis]
MSYQVLARKWRPKRFAEMVGQEHVLKALVNALDQDRLHHAYLFTGTRGVGKTSIARLFAKSLNCEVGVSSEPCGQCSACREIAEGRFIDLIEVDAASRTKVEDTRELLENVQYAPTHGRFKVYLIDEVHMLSSHSFNALLKTLEEPPAHVKFLLATTDPQKLPVTILSRCLQFNLKNLIPERIVEHLQFVLAEEKVGFEDPALWLLARSADGSMRDALSLTDQSIAFGSGTVLEADVRSMLGAIDQRLVYRLLDELTAHNPRNLLAVVAELALFSPDYMNVLGDLISLLHRVAVAQAIPDAIDNSMGDQEQVTALARQLTAEDVQLFYQIALMGRKDLPYVPDAREGLEMVLLRMLAFRPADSAPRPVQLQHEVAASASDAGQAKPAEQTLSPAPAPAPAPAPVVPAPAPEPLAAPDSVPASDLEPPPYDENDIPADDADEEESPAKKPRLPPAEPSESLAAEALVEKAQTEQVAVEQVAVEKTATQPEVKPGVSAELQAEVQADVRAQVKPELRPELKSDARTDQHSEVISGADVKTQADIESEAPTAQAPMAQAPTVLADCREEDWIILLGQIGLTGMTANIASNLSLESVSEHKMVFHYRREQAAVLDDVQKQRIQDVLCDYFKTSIEVEFINAVQTRETPGQCFARLKAERLVVAVSAFESDSIVQMLVSHFDGTIDRDSIVPIDPL